MKRFFSLLLVFLLLPIGTKMHAIAENGDFFTADEQAYDAYLWISDANKKLIHYIEELETLWRINNDTMTSKYRTYDFLCEWLLRDNDAFARYICVSQYVEECGVSLADMQKNNDMITLFESVMSTSSNKEHNMIYAGLSLLLWADSSYLYPLENVQADLEQAKKSIRNLMNIDREYANLDDVQDYYKETVILYNFINDGGYNYSTLSQKLTSAKAMEIAYAIDFEFVFDTTTYAYEDVTAYHNRYALPKDDDILKTGRAFAATYSSQKGEVEKKAATYGMTIDEYNTMITTKQSLLDRSLHRKISGISTISGDLIIVCSDDYYGAVDFSGNTVVPLAYTFIGTISEDKYCATRNGKKGFLNKEGYEVISFEWEEAGYFSEGLASVARNGKYGFINDKGDIVIPLEFEAVRSFSNGMAAVKKNGKWGYVDKTGKTVIPCQYDFANDFTSGLAAVSKNKKYGYIDKSGKVVVNFKYDSAGRFENDIAVVCEKSRYGFIDSTGKTLAKCQYDSYIVSGGKVFNEGLAIVIRNGKKGYVNEAGKEVIPCQYDDCKPFHNGLAATKKNSKWQYIDSTGKTVITTNYAFAGNFSNGYAFVSNGKQGLINETGKLIFPCEYDDIDCGSGIVALLSKGKLTILDAELKKLN